MSFKKKKIKGLACSRFPTLPLAPRPWPWLGLEFAWLSAPGAQPSPRVVGRLLAAGSQSLWETERAVSSLWRGQIATLLPGRRPAKNPHSPRQSGWDWAVRGAIREGGGTGRPQGAPLPPGRGTARPTGRVPGHVWLCARLPFALLSSSCQRSRDQIGSPERAGGSIREGKSHRAPERDRSSQCLVPSSI